MDEQPETPEPEAAPDAAADLTPPALPEVETLPAEEVVATAQPVEEVLAGQPSAAEVVAEADAGLAMETASAEPAPSEEQPSVADASSTLPASHPAEEAPTPEDAGAPPAEHPAATAEGGEPAPAEEPAPVDAPVAAHPAAAQPADSAPVDEALAAQEGAPAPPPAMGDAAAGPAPPAGDTPPAGGEAPPAEPAGEAPPATAAGEGQPGRKRSRSRRRGKSRVADAWGVSPTAAKELAGTPQAVGAPAPTGQRPPAPARRSKSFVPREKGPLPIDDLRDAARAALEMQEDRRGALREALGVLAPRERQDIEALVSDDADVRPRARAIAAGSLAAGKVGKAMAAQQVAFAKVEDLWAIALSKEEAAARAGRVRAAKQRDEQRAKRNAERANRDDRISADQREKARDGSVGAQIRFVIADEKRERRAKKGEEKKTTASDLLDRLGY